MTLGVACERGQLSERGLATAKGAHVNRAQQTLRTRQQRQVNGGGETRAEAEQEERVEHGHSALEPRSPALGGRVSVSERIDQLTAPSAPPLYELHSAPSQ